MQWELKEGRNGRKKMIFWFLDLDLGPKIKEFFGV